MIDCAQMQSAFVSDGAVKRRARRGKGGRKVTTRRRRLDDLPLELPLRCSWVRLYRMPPLTCQYSTHSPLPPSGSPFQLLVPCRCGERYLVGLPDASAGRYAMVQQLRLPVVYTCDKTAVCDLSAVIM